MWPAPVQDLAAVLLVLVVLLTLPLGQVVSSATEVETWVGGEAGSVQKTCAIITCKCSMLHYIHVPFGGLLSGESCHSAPVASPYVPQ